MRVHRALLLAASLTLVAACGTEGSSSASPPSTTPTPERELTCGATPFPRSALANPLGAETLDVRALHEAGEQLSFSLMGVTGPWRILSETPTEVQFAADHPGTFEADDLWVVTVREQAGAWEFENAGTCTPRAARDGIAASSWELPPGGTVEASTRRLTVWVAERNCNDGEAADGRVQEPDVDYEDDAVIVTFWVTARPGLHTCPGNPPTPYELVLDEPLGDRELLDGGTYPPRIPADPFA